jgi:hypothetical protein
MSPIAQILCLCASVAGGPYPQVSSQAGEIRYTHESLSHQRHLLRLSTTDFILDSTEARMRRLHAFAENFAAQTCPKGFRLADGDRPSWPKIHTRYAQQFVFRCR